MKNRPGIRALIAFLLLLVLIIGAGNLWASYAISTNTKNTIAHNHAVNAANMARQAKAAQAAGLLVEQKLCTTFGKLAALQPPTGDAVSNPSREYEQKLHAILAGVNDDINCTAVEDQLHG